ncbi:MAG: transposase domain-containing protein [Lachnospiraceae bacterium]|nr:transposase domain-containing protein [Lachnospiraceae bacterium]
MIDTLSGADASAVIYSLVETAKANNLNVYEYMKHLLTVIPNHMDDKDTSFCEKLLPWSDELPKCCQKKT